MSQFKGMKDKTEYLVQSFREVNGNRYPTWHEFLAMGWKGSKVSMKSLNRTFLEAVKVAKKIDRAVEERDCLNLGKLMIAFSM